MITVKEAYELSEKKVAYHEARKSKKVQRILKRIEKKIIAESENNNQMLQYYLWNVSCPQISAIIDLLEEAGYATKFVKKNKFRGDRLSIYVYWNKDVLERKKNK